jgi:hypothetical protein
MIRSLDTHQQQKTLAAMSLIWIGLDASIRALTSVVDGLSDHQKDACIRELRYIRTPVSENALKRIQQRRVPTPLEPPPLLDQPGQTRLSWTVLPVGWWSNPKYARIVTRWSKDRPAAELILGRLRFLDNLYPRERYLGQERFGSDPYWVFVFDEHVAAECPMEGNAVYIVTGTHDWRTLLNQSKRDLRINARHRFEKIVHRGDWKSRIIKALEGRVG